jgi:hypothetical protein
MTNKTKQYGLWAGLLLCSAVVASANTLVTFQVDMSTASFDPSSQTVSAHGDFNAWGAGIALTNNPSGANPSLWSGTANVAANGTVMQYKYVIDPAGAWESIPKGNNRLAILPATSGASLVLPMVYYADNPPAPISVDFTFQVDMAQQINVGAFDPNSSTVWPKGTFNGWGTFDGMTNDPTILRTNQNGLVTSNVYVNTYTVSGSPGETMDFKFYIDTGNIYESPAPGAVDPSDNNNRFFNLSAGPTQAFPLVFFSDLPYAPVATIAMTFQVDMTAQVFAGNFDPTTGTVEVRGDFNSWGPPNGPQILCTNDLTAPNTNLYTAVVTVVNGVGATENYKFWSSVSANSGWETMANNRTFTMTKGASQILPPVFFDNIDPTDLLPADTLVTFTVNMAAAAQYPSGTPFDPSVNGVWFNGDCLTNGWYSTWGAMWPETQLFDDGTHGDAVAGDHIYTCQYLVPKGKTVRVQYKYGIDSSDNENASGSDHVRYIRSVGTYVMPLDTFGSIANNEPAPGFGNLTIGHVSGGHVPISWLGLPGVHLQSASNLTGGVWQDLLATEGLNSTNYPVGTAPVFFRLIKP